MSAAKVARFQHRDLPTRCGRRSARCGQAEGKQSGRGQNRRRRESAQEPRQQRPSISALLGAKNSPHYVDDGTHLGGTAAGHAPHISSACSTEAVKHQCAMCLQNSVAASLIHPSLLRELRLSMCRFPALEQVVWSLLILGVQGHTSQPGAAAPPAGTTTTLAGAGVPLAEFPEGRFPEASPQDG